MSGECHQIAYKSRFMQDFEPVRKIVQLDSDRVVFEARKRTDLVHYAVERVRLPEFKKDRNEVVRKAKVHLTHNLVYNEFYYIYYELDTQLGYLKSFTTSNSNL